MNAKAILLMIAMFPAGALAADQVFRGRLAENPNNMVACRGLDEQIEREHTVTISGDKAEYTAPGGTRLRFDSKGPGLYGTVEELGPERMRYTFSPSTGAFTIRENNIGCIWSGTLLRQP
jgi:hypothetical protein